MKPISTFLKTVSFAVLVFFVSAVCCLAQDRKPDIIIKKDNSKVEAVIQEIDKATIKYKKFSDPSGPTFTLEKIEVVSILYGNGEVEVISQPKASEITSSVAAESNASKKKTSEKRIDIASLSQKKQKFVAQYLNTPSEKLALDMKKYKRRSATGKIIGTTFATAGLATIIIGILNYLSADEKAESTFGGADPGQLFGKGFDKYLYNII